MNGRAAMKELMLQACMLGAAFHTERQGSQPEKLADILATHG